MLALMRHILRVGAQYLNNVLSRNSQCIHHEKHQNQVVYVKHFLRQILYFRFTVAYLHHSCLARLKSPESETKAWPRSKCQTRDEKSRQWWRSWRVEVDILCLKSCGSVKLHPVPDTQLLSPDLSSQASCLHCCQLWSHSTDFSGLCLASRVSLGRKNDSSWQSCF